MPNRLTAGQSYLKHLVVKLETESSLDWNQFHPSKDPEASPTQVNLLLCQQRTNDLLRGILIALERMRLGDASPTSTT